MSIGKRIRNLRIDAGLTQKQLAEISGLAEITIRQYENGKREPKLQALMKISNALDVAIIYFLDDGNLDNDTIDILMTQQRLNHMRLPNELSAFLTHNEIYLLSLYRELNEIGQERADAAIFDLTQVPHYRIEPKRRHWKTPLPTSIALDDSDSTKSST